jgi:hypothetical protein
MPDLRKLNLTTPKVEELCRAMSLESCPAGTAVFRQGDYGDKVGAVQAESSGPRFSQVKTSFVVVSTRKR